MLTSFKFIQLFTSYTQHFNNFMTNGKPWNKLWNRVWDSKFYPIYYNSTLAWVPSIYNHNIQGCFQVESTPKLFKFMQLCTQFSQQTGPCSYSCYHLSTKLKAKQSIYFFINEPEKENTTIIIRPIAKKQYRNDVIFKRENPNYGSTCSKVLNDLKVRWKPLLIDRNRYSKAIGLRTNLFEFCGDIPLFDVSSFSVDINVSLSFKKKKNIKMSVNQSKYLKNPQA